MNKEYIMELSAISALEEFPSKTAKTIISTIENTEFEEWDIDILLVFVEAAISTNSNYSFEELDELMLGKKAEGYNNYSWNSLMANISYNMQSSHSVKYMKRALRLNGKNPEINYASMISNVLYKLENNVTDFTDEEILALYLQENPSLQ